MQHRRLLVGGRGFRRRAPDRTGMVGEVPQNELITGVDQSANVIFPADVGVNELGLRPEKAQFLCKCPAGFIAPERRPAVAAEVADTHGRARRAAACRAREYVTQRRGAQATQSARNASARCGVGRQSPRFAVFVSAIFEFSCLSLHAGLSLWPQKKMAPQQGHFPRIERLAISRNVAHA